MIFPHGSIVNNCSTEQFKKLLNIKPITCFICGSEAHGAIKEVPQAEVTFWDEKNGELVITLCECCFGNISISVLELAKTERAKGG